MALYDTKIITGGFQDFLTYSTDYFNSFGVLALLAFWIIIFRIIYNGRNLNSATTVATFTINMIGFVFFWTGMVGGEVIVTTMVVTGIGTVLLMLNRRPTA